jgi:RNA polymerase sigma factor (sigma-70 family)
MASKSASPLLAFIRRLAASQHQGELTDAELLQRFTVQRDQTAFAALMHRHGPMVLSVCQGILQNVHDAEDTFQATFLVLVRKPKTIAKPASLASWLHGVAYRLAMKARAEAARRHARERLVVAMPHGDLHEEAIWRDLRPILHQEIDRLPEKYRLPFVLCYLEGKTNAEAAALLGRPKGTILSSLARARERLRSRLTRRGVALTSGMLVALVSQHAARAAVSATLAESTLRAALLFASGSGAVGGIATPLLAAAQGLLREAFVAKLKLTVALLLAVSVTGTGAVVWVYRAAAGVHEDIVTDLTMPTNRTQGNSTPAAPKSADPVEDRDRLQGAWVVSAAEQYGRRINLLDDRRLVFAGNRFTLSGGRGEVRGIIPGAELKGEFTLERTSPRRIELKQDDLKRIWQLQRSWHLRGTYEFEGDILRVRLNQTFAGEQPAGFTTKPSSEQLLLTLKRE